MTAIALHEITARHLRVGDGSEEVVLHDAKSRAEAHTTLVGAVQRLREVAP